MVDEEISSQSLRFVTDKAIKPTARMLVGILKAYMRHRHDKKYFGKNAEKTGKMPVKKIIKQGRGVQKIELDGEDIHMFNRLAKKYGVDYAVVKDKEAGTYKIFFKAQDADAISDLIAAYAAKALKKTEHPRESILDKLKKFKDIIAAIPRKVAEKRKEHMR
jgi:hypothetical protein